VGRQIKKSFLENGSMLLKKLGAGCVDHLSRKARKEEAFVENGSRVLEELVASCNGRPPPIRSFSYQELKLATNNFDPHFVLHEDPWYILYKGSHEGRIISIKKYKTLKTTRERDFPYTELSFSAKMSAHNNVLRLIGCCLETRFPIVVYEYAENGTLADRLCVSDDDGARQQWQSRLKIAREIAYVIAYLHTAFSRPIIHRNIEPQYIFLDQHDIPKLSNFSISVSIPEGESHVEDHRMDSPVDYGWISEKTDVYCFGTLLMKIMADINLANLQREGRAGVEEQYQAVLGLARGCIDEELETRPTMVNVTKELRRIVRFVA
jgi:serine/threonine protein kinase